MNASESFAAAIFYCALVLGAIGVVLAARSTIERRRTDRRGLVFVGVAVVAICVSIGLYAAGPHRVLPF